MARRHSSLIPLSHDHREALGLAFRLHNPAPPGRVTAMTPASTPQSRAAETLEFFERHLGPHFRAEEEALFPFLEAWPGADDALRVLVARLVEEHHSLAERRDAIVAAADVAGDLERCLTDFADLLPQQHPYIELHNSIKDSFGGANVLTVGVEFEDGDIFTNENLAKIDRITQAVDNLPGVNHNLVSSVTHRNSRKIWLTEVGSINSEPYYDSTSGEYSRSTGCHESRCGGQPTGVRPPCVSRYENGPGQGATD